MTDVMVVVYTSVTIYIVFHGKVGLTWKTVICY